MVQKFVVSVSCLILFFHFFSFSSFANPPKVLYHFSEESRRCQNINDEPGYNRDVFHPCTDFTGMSFRKKNATRRLERIGVQLQGSLFRKMTLSSVFFKGADLRYVDFRGASLPLSDFSKTDLRGADFRGADLSGVTFTGASENRYRRYPDRHDRKNPFQLEGALFDDHTDLSTLYSRYGKGFASPKDWAISKGMVRWAKASDHEVEVDEIIEGATFHSYGFNIETLEGTCSVNIGTKLAVFPFNLERIAEDLSALSPGDVLRIGLSKGGLFYVDPYVIGLKD